MEYHKNDTIFSAYVIGASILVGAILISATIFYNFRLFSSGSNVANPGTAQVAAGANPVKITLKSGTPYLGNANSKVTVVEYADYRCPYCEKFYKDVISELKTKYIDTNKIKFVYQDFAFLGPDSSSAAEASHCAGDQNMFWQYHDYLFDHQGDESTDWASVAHQKQFATTLGLNTTLFNQCLDSGKYKQQVKDETAAGKSYGANGTPTTFVNGKILVGLQPLDTFVQAIDAALK
jgi:protein-disulfide isomerase